MATKLYVNTQAGSIRSALVRSPVDLTPVPFPTLVIGDFRDYEIYFIDGRNGFQPWSGDAAYSPFLAIGDCGYPTGGTFTLALPSQTPSAAIAYNASPAAVQTALQAAGGVGSGNVTVTGVAGRYYEFEFIGALANTNVGELIVNISALEGIADVSTIQEGGGGANDQQVLALSSNPLAYADSWSPITNGWAGELSTNTLAMLAAFVAAGSETISKTFQVTVANPGGDRVTYVKAPVTIECTIIEPEAFAGANKPNLVTQAQLAAAVLGANNFTREALSSTTAGNTNVTRPSTSRHHAAVVAVTGSASTRTVSILTTNSPTAGSVVMLSIQPNTTPGNVVEVRNATSGGTLLDTFTTDSSGRAVFLVLIYDGAAWQVFFSENNLLTKAGNLAGIANRATARANLRTLFSRVSTQSASFSVTTADDGTFYNVSASAGAVVATLPAAGTAGVGFTLGFKKSDLSGNALTTSPATMSLRAVGASMVLVSDGTAWQVAAAYNPGDTANSFEAVTNNLGNTTIQPASREHVEIVTITGGVSVRVLILDIADQTAGNVVNLRVNLPATAGIEVEIRNATAGGTELYSLTSDAGGQSAFFKIYFDGTAWQRLMDIFPVL